MGQYILIVGILAFLSAAFYFFYPRWEKYYKHRPKLVVELASNDGISRTQTYVGLSSKNKDTVIQAGDPNTWHLYRFEWRFDLLVRNNSEFSAYEIILFQHKSKPLIQFRKRVNFNKALKPQEEILLPFKIHSYTECQSKDREKIFSNDPELFDDLMLVFDYKNPQGRNFQSRYFFNDDKTLHDRIPAKELEKYWR